MRQYLPDQPETWSVRQTTHLKCYQIQIQLNKRRQCPQLCVCIWNGPFFVASQSDKSQLLFIFCQSCKYDSYLDSLEGFVLDSLFLLHWLHWSHVRSNSFFLFFALLFNSIYVCVCVISRHGSPANMWCWVKEGVVHSVAQPLPKDHGPFGDTT